MKIEKVTNLEIMEFLQDFEISSEISILEEGKEKSELEKIAEARGMKIKGSRDLAIFKTIYAFTDKPNSNGAILPKKELLRILPQIIGKPVNINHNRRFVVGHYIDYKFIQKENKVIAYGVFYKSNFGDEWARALEFLKRKKLSSSFEIWSPDNKRENVGRGKYKLHVMELAGGAIIYEDKNNAPAFKDAKVLNMARKEIPELVYASKYKPEEIITSNKDYFRDSVEENLKKLNEEKKNKIEETKEEKEAKDVDLVKEKEVKVEDKKTEKPKIEKEVKKEEVKVETKTEEKKETVENKEVKPEEKKVEEPKVQDNKIKCSNCNEEFEHIILPHVTVATTIDCPKCKAILKQDGTMIYPPQIIDFKVSCPSCRMGRWLLMEKNDKEAKVRCSCKKEYVLTIAEEKDTEMIDKMNFPYSGSVSCSQCGKINHYEGISGVTSRNIKCNKCGLEFPIDINEAKKYKIISRIEEIEVKKIVKSSEQGGNEIMKIKSDEQKDEVTKPKDLVESKEVTKEEVKVEEPKTEELSGNDLVNSMIDEPTIVETAKEAVAEASIEKVDTKIETTEEKPVDKYVKSKLLRKAVTKIKNFRLELEIAKKKIKESKANLYKSGINKLTSQVISLKKEVAKIKDEMGKKIEFYKANAIEINKRREELSDFGKELTDEQILNTDKFEKAQLEKENAELKSGMEKSSEVVGLKKKDDGYYAKKRKEIDNVAFGKNKKKKIK